MMEQHLLTRFEQSLSQSTAQSAATAILRPVLRSRDFSRHLGDLLEHGAVTHALGEYLPSCLSPEQLTGAARAFEKQVAEGVRNNFKRAADAFRITVTACRKDAVRLAVRAAVHRRRHPVVFDTRSDHELSDGDDDGDGDGGDDGDDGDDGGVIVVVGLT
eukprot:TRINITY_DN66345_c3_g3_i1.p2 TRINITY_DN66345_c3_g3~~TRINITY_DN66345_c3_g3_i1.p2  ORF type:complete len:160 (-),score=73.76 TRINITY_DN66345_c3_g3_i1:22-501(-)